MKATQYTGVRSPNKGRTVVISASDLASLRANAVPEAQKAIQEYQKEPEANRREEMARQRSATWNNTIIGLQQQRLAEAKQRELDREAEMMRIHEEEAAREAEEHDRIIQRAVDFYKRETEPARIVVQAKEAVNVKREQLKQMEEKKERREQEKMEELQFAAELRRLSDLEMSKKKEDLDKIKNSENERKKVNLEQIQLNKLKKEQAEREKKAELERAKLAAKEEKARQEAATFERIKQQRKSDIDNAKFIELGLQVKAANAERDKLEELEIEFYNNQKEQIEKHIKEIKEKKEKEAALRREKLTEMSAEALVAEKAKHAVWEGLKDDTFFDNREKDMLARDKKWEEYSKEVYKTNEAIIAAKRAKERVDKEREAEIIAFQKKKRQEEEELEKQKQQELIQRQLLYKQAQKSQINEHQARLKAEKEYTIQYARTEFTNLVDNPKKDAMQELKDMDNDPETHGALLVAGKRINALV